MQWTTRSMEAELDEKGILHIKPPENFKGPETLEHAQENIAVLHKEIGDRVKGILAIMPNHYVNVAATGYYKKHAPEVPFALVAESAFKNMMGNFMLSLLSPGRPMKLFKSMPEAQKWLNEKMNL